jgi:hypothetical protein
MSVKPICGGMFIFSLRKCCRRVNLEFNTYHEKAGGIILFSQEDEAGGKLSEDEIFVFSAHDKNFAILSKEKISKHHK